MDTTSIVVGICFKGLCQVLIRDQAASVCPQRCPMPRRFPGWRTIVLNSIDDPLGVPGEK
jgi:hypothetical protein